MNIQTHRSASGIVLAGMLLLLSACAAPPAVPQGADTARSRLMQLQSDPELASRAPVEIREAENAVEAAEVPRDDEEYARHLVMIANHKVDIARARAQSRLYEDQRRELSEERERARLEARTREAAEARAEARSAREEAVAARMEAEATRAESEELQQQIAELNARETDRGLVVTLGDVLFATGKSELMGGASGNLNKLAAFLKEYKDRSVLIEGHTDNVGSDEYNQALSEQRADAVQSYLVDQGISPNRITTSGLGESRPIASNDSPTGRQQNRRVEVIISTPERDASTN